MENKQTICDLLCETLRQTRNHRDLLRIEYDWRTEMVTLKWKEGTRSVNTAMDSGTALIRDIMRAID